MLFDALIDPMRDIILPIAGKTVLALLFVSLIASATVFLLLRINRNRRKKDV